MVALGRRLVVVFAGIAGFVVLGLGWFQTGHLATVRLVATYPPTGKGPESVSHPAVAAVRSVWLYGTPAAAVVGGTVGVIVGRRLVRPTRRENPFSY